MRVVPSPIVTSTSPKKNQWRWTHTLLAALFHGNRCPIPHGCSCPVSNKCHHSKRLWNHVIGCNNTQCQVSNCIPARQVLLHFSKCKKALCPVCGPVVQAMPRLKEGIQQIAANESEQRIQVHLRTLDAQMAPISAGKPSLQQLEQMTKNKTKNTRSMMEQRPKAKKSRTEPSRDDSVD